MATHSRRLKRFAGGPLHGAALALYFVLLPYVVLSKWGPAAHQTNGPFIRALLVGLSCFWLLFLFQFARNVNLLRRGLLAGGGGSAWLAGLIVALLPFILTSVPSSPVRPPDSVSTSWYSPADARTPLGEVAAPSLPPRHLLHRPVDLSVLSAIPLALRAKRRGDLLRQQQFDLDDGQIDDTVALLRSADPGALALVRQVIGDRRDGIVCLTGQSPSGVAGDPSTPLAVCVLRDDVHGVWLSFASEGGSLRIPLEWSDDDVIDEVVALHDSGHMSFTRSEPELLRTLATRVLRNTLVIHLGAAHHLDDGLRACAVTVMPVTSEEIFGENSSTNCPVRVTGTQRYETTAGSLDIASSEVRAEVLRADPRIVGLVEAFTPTLRRRCVEMATYLAVHRREPVTGDRLRTRVLTNADVDASSRTLANTASAVRRSLGIDAKGPRLHPVTSSGLYVTHGLTSDIEVFHSLIARARQLPLDDAAPFIHRALSLVRGEPLASVLRGFEWFLAEGFAARLQRDGEWAALALHQHAISIDDVELAFWALEKGRLVDPYSDVLLEVMARVPRLRQFGGDGARGTQNQPVGARGAVAVGWSFNGLGH